MEHRQLRERWGVGFSTVSFEYTDPALSAAGIQPGLLSYASYYFSKALSKILEREGHTAGENEGPVRRGGPAVTGML